ncbi:MAG: carboxymuconolactone decarboxylase family protein [Anaerolineae bacterium]
MLFELLAVHPSLHLLLPLSQRDYTGIPRWSCVHFFGGSPLKSHIRIGLQNGLTREEIAEAITHMAFYAGWPCAVNAVRVAREVFAEQD